MRINRYKQVFFNTFKEFGNDAGVEWYTEIQFMNGMLPEKTKSRIYAKMKSIKIINGLNTDLKIDKPVYDIEFELIKE